MKISSLIKKFFNSNNAFCGISLIELYDLYEYALFIPNAFSPNGDNKNDVFTPFYNGVTKAELDIFNRWSELMYTSNVLHDSWDGTYKGELVKQGVSVYQITVKNTFNKTITKKGHVNVIR